MWIKISVGWWVKKQTKKTPSVNKTLKARRNIFSCVYTIRDMRDSGRASVHNPTELIFSYTPTCTPGYLSSCLDVCAFTLPHRAQSCRPTCKHMITPHLLLTTGKMWTRSPWRRAIISLRHCLLFILLPSASRRAVHYLWKTTGEANQARRGYYIVVCMCFIYGCERMYIKWFFLMYNSHYE